jgi:hypothetical protein
MRTLWSALFIGTLALLMSACGGDPVAGDDCDFQETGDIFCAEGGKVLECTYVNAARQWSEIATCPSETSCQTTDDFRGYACE